MTAMGIALSVSLALVATALGGALRPREWSWKHKPARLAMVAQGLLGLVLVAGMLWDDHSEIWSLSLAGWMLGSIAGSIVSFIRARQQPSEVDG